MTDPLSSSTPVAPNSLLDLNMNLNYGTMVHADMYNLMYRQPDTLHEPVLFGPHGQIRHSCTMFNAAGFVDFIPLIKSFHSLEKDIGWSEEWLTDVGMNQNHKFMEHNLSTIINRTPPLGDGVSAHITVSITNTCYVYN